MHAESPRLNDGKHKKTTRTPGMIGTQMFLNGAENHHMRKCPARVDATITPMFRNDQVLSIANARE